MKSVKELRESMNMSQREFAEYFHMDSVRGLQGWEQGWRECPSHILYMMNRILELEGKI